MTGLASMIILQFALLPANVLFSQTLAEAARKEAERRRVLRQEGVAAKVITSVDFQLDGSQGRLATSSVSPARVVAAKSEAATAGRLKAASSYRTQLDRLDREISRGEDQLKLLKERAAREKWAPPKVGRLGRTQSPSSSLDQLQWKIRELEMKLRELRAERLEVYGRGRREGFLPGELEGRGVMP